MTAMSPIEQIAKAFHDAYERLAPDHGYKTREASAVPWDDVPPANKALMIATVEALIVAGDIWHPHATGPWTAAFQFHPRAVAVTHADGTATTVTPGDDTITAAVAAYALRAQDQATEGWYQAEEASKQCLRQGAKIKDLEAKLAEARLDEKFAQRAWTASLGRIDQLDQQLETERARVAELTGHSVTLNAVGWKIAQTLGDIPDGAHEHFGDIAVDVDRLIARLAAIEARLDQAQLASIEARNPGIDMDEVRRFRATGELPT
jgi:hypothetical protein